jgi:hypothetical protein
VRLFAVPTDLLKNGLDWLFGQLREHVSDATTCTIQRQSRTSDGYTGQTVTWTTEATGVPCLYQPLADKSLERQGRDAQIGRVRVVFNQPVNLTRDHRLLIGDKTLVVFGEVDAEGLGSMVVVECELARG